MGKKFCKLLSFIGLILLIAGLFDNALANTASQAFVVQGRSHLFNTGNPTLSDLLTANEQFKNAVDEDNTDQEANLFYAVTRLLANCLEQDGAGSISMEIADETATEPPSSVAFAVIVCVPRLAPVHTILNGSSDASPILVSPL